MVNFIQLGKFICNMRKFMIILSYLQAFMLGAYFVSEFKFNTPVEGYRWLLTSFFFVMSLVGANDTKRR
jgi:hypothetical protein